MAFKPSHEFKREYDRLFRKNPLAANLFLLLTELADDRGRVQASDKELADLMAARFNSPDEYAFGGKGR